MRRLDISSLIYEDDIPGVGDKDNIINMSNNAKETGKTQMLYLLSWFQNQYYKSTANY